jgi:hypothetical protein
MNTVILNTKKGQTFEMSIPEFSRWMCLMEALTIIYTKADEMGVNGADMVNAVAIDEYINGSKTYNKVIDGRFHSMLHDVKCELENGSLVM